MSADVIGVLALQGAFREHALALQSLGAATREVRQRKDLEGLAAIVLPGGESTTIGKLLVELEMLEPLRGLVVQGMPAFGTCAGLIMLCKNVEGSEQPTLGILDATVRRNAFGRQVDSFETDLPVRAIGEPPFPAVFIRAPLLASVASGVEILAEVNRSDRLWPVAVRQGNVLATSFHPELTPDARFHKYFLNMFAR